MTGPARLADLLREGARRLTAAGVASPRADVELLAAHVLSGGRLDRIVGRGEVQAMALRGDVLEADEAAALAGLLDRRAARVPLQHLTGTASFRGLVLAVGPGVFVPRPETEVLAGLAIDEAARLASRGAPSSPSHPDGEPPGAPVVVDLCAGSAAVAVAVAAEVPAARVVALELEPAALAWARRNVDALAPAVDLRAGDVVGSAGGVLADLAGRVDVVASNPPYIPPGARPVDPEVADHDPAPALYGGGADGLDVPRGVVAAAARLLRPGGLLAMEHADVQGGATRALVSGPGWTAVRTVPDLTGRDRVLLARRAGHGSPSGRSGAGSRPSQ